MILRSSQFGHSLATIVNTSYLATDEPSCLVTSASQRTSPCGASPRGEICLQVSVTVRSSPAHTGDKEAQVVEAVVGEDRARDPDRRTGQPRATGSGSRALRGPRKRVGPRRFLVHVRVEVSPVNSAKCTMSSTVTVRVPVTRVSPTRVHQRLAEGVDLPLDRGARRRAPSGRSSRASTAGRPAPPCAACSAARRERRPSLRRRRRGRGRRARASAAATRGRWTPAPRRGRAPAGGRARGEAEHDRRPRIGVGGEDRAGQDAPRLGREPTASFASRSGISVLTGPNASTSCGSRAAFVAAQQHRRDERPALGVGPDDVDVAGRRTHPASATALSDRRPPPLPVAGQRAHPHALARRIADLRPWRAAPRRPRRRVASTGARTPGEWPCTSGPPSPSSRVTLLDEEVEFRGAGAASGPSIEQLRESASTLKRARSRRRSVGAQRAPWSAEPVKATQSCRPGGRADRRRCRR